MPNRKSKMVSFRLSADEYDAFRAACQATGVRTISELARTAMQHLVPEDQHEPSLHQLEEQIGEIRGHVSRLSAEVDRLHRRIGDILEQSV